jgi:hypothetical protein
MQLTQLQEYTSAIGLAYQQKNLEAVLEKLYEFGIFLQLEYPGKDHSAICEKELAPFLSQLNCYKFTSR